MYFGFSQLDNILDWTRRETPERQLGFVVALIPVIERCQHAQCERGRGYAPLGVPPPPDAVTAGGIPPAELHCRRVTLINVKLAFHLP